MYQRKSATIFNNPSYKRQSKPSPCGETPNQSQPKFILKNHSHQHRALSALDYSDEAQFNSSYYEIYQQQKQRQSSSSPDIYDPSSRQNQNIRNPPQIIEKDNSQSSISIKLQQILQKQIANPKQPKSKTQHTSNSSFEILNHNQGRKANNSYHVFPTNNQITFSNENNEVEEIAMLRTENKKLLNSIKKLNLDFQSQKTANNSLQIENQKLRSQLLGQNEELSNVLEIVQKDKFVMQQQIDQKDTLIQLLKQQLYDKGGLRNVQQGNSTHQEIDDLKSRIMARKTTQSSSRENNSSQDSRGRLLNCDDILDQMDSSARLDIKTIRQQITDDKENLGRMGNLIKKPLLNQNNQFRLRK